MNRYEVQWVRVEHKVALIEVEAKDRNEAHTKAVEIARSNAIEDYEMEVVHAEEFVNDIDLIEGDEDVI